MDVEQSETRAPTARQQLKPSKVRDQRLMDLSANRLTMTVNFLPTELFPVLQYHRLQAVALLGTGFIRKGLFVICFQCHMQRRVSQSL